MVHTAFADAFAGPQRFARDEGGVVRTEVRRIGELLVPTGRLVVSDPFTTPFDAPEVGLARTAPTGTFPVEVVVARYDNDDQRVACARVHFGGVAVRWEPALFEGQAAPPDGAIAGYGVDAGMGCFFDAAAVGAVGEDVSAAWLAATEARSVPTWTWHVAAVGPANVVMFSSGWGDGFYGSYWGFDAAGSLVELVTDFELLVEPVTARFERPLPLSRGRLEHPLLAEHDVTARVPLWSRRSLVLSGKGHARVTLSDGSEVETTWTAGGRKVSWGPVGDGTRLVVAVVVGVRAMKALA